MSDLLWAAVITGVSTILGMVIAYYTSSRISLSAIKEQEKIRSSDRLRKEKNEAYVNTIAVLGVIRANWLRLARISDMQKFQETVDELSSINRSLETQLALAVAKASFSTEIVTAYNEANNCLNLTAEELQNVRFVSQENLEEAQEIYNNNIVDFNEKYDVFICLIRREFQLDEQ